MQLAHDVEGGQDTLAPLTPGRVFQQRHGLGPSVKTSSGSLSRCSLIQGRVCFAGLPAADPSADPLLTLALSPPPNEGHLTAHLCMLAQAGLGEAAQQGAAAGAGLADPVQVEQDPCRAVLEDAVLVPRRGRPLRGVACVCACVVAV